MIDVMAVLYDNGIVSVHMGALMRLLGVPDNRACEYDGEILELDEKFGAMLTELNKTANYVEVPEDVTFH